MAARRRAKAALKSSPIRIGEGNASASRGGCAPMIIPPPLNAARQNMRNRMQNNNKRIQSSLFGSNNNSSNDVLPRDFDAFALDPTSIDDEVNSALNELKSDHPEMEFAFEKMGHHSRGDSVDSSVSGRGSTNIGGVGGVRGSNVPAAPAGSFEPPGKLERKVSKGATAGRNSPITVGSVKTLTTKSLTIESSVERCSESSSLTDTSDWHHASFQLRFEGV